MPPKMGRPTDDHKNRGYRLRVSEVDLEKLDFCAEVFGLTKAEIIRKGIDQMYAKALSKEQE